MTGGELTLGAVLAQVEEREQQIAVQAEATGERIAQLTAQLDELGRAAEEVRITRKTLRELPVPQPPAPSPPKLPDHPAYQQIMAVFAAADALLRARQVCEAMDLGIAHSNINNTRLKLKRLAERRILVETKQGLFTQPWPYPPGNVAASSHSAPESANGHQLAYRPVRGAPPDRTRAGWPAPGRGPVHPARTVVPPGKGSGLEAGRGNSWEVYASSSYRPPPQQRCLQSRGVRRIGMPPRLPRLNSLNTRPLPARPLRRRARRQPRPRSA
jgi:hypothetical protein